MFQIEYNKARKTRRCMKIKSLKMIAPPRRVIRLKSRRHIFCYII